MNYCLRLLLPWALLGMSVGCLSAVEATNVPLAAKTLEISVKVRDARATVYVNSNRQEIAGNDISFRVTIGEGMHAIAVSAEAQGPNPGVNIHIKDQPETEGRWRVANEAAEGWRGVEFNDNAWPMVAGGGDGFIWSTNGGSTNVLLRQVVLWNERHDGPNRCIVPPIKEWGFSQKSLETLRLALYSPLPYPLTEYEFILEVPEAFRRVEGWGYLGNLRQKKEDSLSPEKVMEEEVTRNGKKYRRYRLFYPAERLMPDQTYYTLVPIKMDQSVKEETVSFYYRRSGRGNFTELEQAIPVRILPPICGRKPKHIMIIPSHSATAALMSGEYLETSIKQDLAAGMNFYFLGLHTGYSDGWAYQKYVRQFQDLVTDNGGRIILWISNNYPLYASNKSPTYDAQGIVVKDVFREWVSKTPAAQARMFGGGGGGYFCPLYMTTEGVQTFREKLKQDYAAMLAALPAAEIMINDWEQAPWAASGIYTAPPGGKGKGSWCFCDRCKQAFREFAHLPDTADLSDESIFKTYGVEWHNFRSYLDGQVQGQIRQVCRELDKPYMLYIWTIHYKLWEACKDKIDIAFPGCPGNPFADGDFQGYMDKHRLIWRTNGFEKVVGQQFPFYPSGGKDGWKNNCVVGNQSTRGDIYLHPKRWKLQVLRIIATFQRGVDLSEGANRIVGGMHYYIGEATRVISEYEDLFREGERADDLAVSAQIQYPNLLVLQNKAKSGWFWRLMKAVVLQKGKERLVLAFNESSQPISIILQNKNIQPGQIATVYGTNIKERHPEQMVLAIGPEDVAVIHIK